MSAYKSLKASAAVALVLSSTTAVAADTTLSVIASQNWIPEAEQEIAKQFEAETGIKVEFQAIPDDQYHNVLKARLNSGEVSDIYMGQSGYSDLLTYNVKETAVDLSDQEWASRIKPLVREAASIDDKFYGLTYWPAGEAPFIYNYNIKLFEENGIEIPKTFDELLQVCSNLKEAGIIPIYEPFADGWHHVLMFAHSGPKFNADQDGLYDKLNANEIKYAGNQEMIDNLNEIKQLYDEGCFGDNALSDQYSASATKFTNEEVAIVYSRASFFSEINAEYPDYDPANIGVFAVPLSDNQFLGINPAGPTKFVFAKGENIDAAKQYLSYLMRDDVINEYMSLPTGPQNLPIEGVPGRLPEGIQKTLADQEDMKRVVMQTAVNYFNPQWMDIGQDMTAMVTGMIPAETVLENIDKRRADMAKAAGDAAWQ